LQRAVSDARLEQQRLDAFAVELVGVAEVLEHAEDGAEDRRDGLAALVRLEHRRAAEDDVIGEQRDGRVHVGSLDRGAEGMKRHPGSLRGSRWIIARMRVRIADHLGWAVAVTASADHAVVDRRQIELVEPGLSAAPIHYESSRLDVAATAALVATVRASVARATAAALDELAAALPAPVRSRSGPGRSTSLTTSPSSGARRTRPGPTRSCTARSSPTSRRLAAGRSTSTTRRRWSGRPSACWPGGPTRCCRVLG